MGLCDGMRERVEEVRRYTVVFNHLRAEALGTGQSIDLIAQSEHPHRGRQ
jgi:hypothetical protein